MSNISVNILITSNQISRVVIMSAVGMQVGAFLCLEASHITSV